MPYHAGFIKIEAKLVYIGFAGNMNEIGTRATIHRNAFGLGFAGINYADR
jgi:hypothetical protein